LRGFSTHRIWRAALIGCLLLTQFELLWMAVFHWNEEPLPVPACTATLRESSRRAAPFDHSAIPCVVCQIVRQNAVRPSAGTPAPQPVTAVWFQLAVPSDVFHSIQPHVANGRAPPLS
jgi:hypothetical protein